MRNQSRRSRKKKWSFLPKWQTLLKISIISILFVLLWQGWQYTKPKNFPLKHVRVVATFQHISPQEIQKIAEPYLNNGFFYLNVFGLKHQLLKMPWAYDISINRIWPDTLSINIVEQQTIAKWGENSLINADGQIFSPDAATFPQNLPLLLGPDNSEANILQIYIAAQNLLKPLNLTIKQLILNPYHYWQIGTNTDTMVFLREQDPLLQLKFLVSVYSKIAVNHNTMPKTIDLRYNNGMAVKW